jgi:hypothetical protein
MLRSIGGTLICGLLLLAPAARPLAAQEADSSSPAAAQLTASNEDSQSAPPSPEEYLARPVGTDFLLADWDQVSDYYRKLADASPRVLLEKVGETTEGRDFLIAVISSEENLERLDEIKAYARTIADPRGKSDDEKQQALQNGKVIVFVTPTMHATEVAATEMGMQLAWQLATSDEDPWRTAREKTVVVVTPSLNPDGVDHVVHWYREHAFTPFEGASLNKLYQFYTGHDNNRDWFMLTQVETRHLTRLLYQEWFPTFLWDVHQQGNSKERFFVPPYRDPLNPNLDPGIVAGINAIGSRAAMDMAREGLSGVATGVSYDNWWNGGNRSVPCRHNIIGILTEAASAKIASPIFQSADSLNDPLGSNRYQPSNQFVNPWPGGWWRLSDIIRYELAFGRSLLSSINREPQFWLSNAMEAAQRCIEAGRTGSPRGWLITVDNRDRGAVRRLVDVLLASGIEIHVSSDAFEADGRSYPAGTIVIRRDQPYGNFVKDLFELQDFPSGTRPYDVTGWTVPLLLGVRRIEITHEFTADTRPVNTPEEALAALAGDPRVIEAASGAVLSSLDSDTWTQVVSRLTEEHPHRFLTGGPRAGLFVPLADDGELVAVSAGEADSEAARDSNAAGIDLKQLPRIGVYAPWSGSMDEGWLRWVLDHFEIPFTTVRNETLRAGDVGSLVDVLIIPDVSATQLNHGRRPTSTPEPFSKGLDPEGALAVEEFVGKGGTLITFDGSCAWAIDLLQLPLVDVTKESSAKSFSCPGSVLRGVFEPHRLTAGLGADTALFFSGSVGWRSMTRSEREEAGRDERKLETLLKYASTRLLLSGYIDKPEAIEGHSAWVTCRHGDGRVHLFGFRPHYRGWTQATFHLLFRAMLLDPSEAAGDQG